MNQESRRFSKAKIKIQVFTVSVNTQGRKLDKKTKELRVE